MLFLELKLFDLNLCETMKFFIRLINYRARRASSMIYNWDRYQYIRHWLF